MPRTGNSAKFSAGAADFTDAAAADFVSPLQDRGELTGSELPANPGFSVEGVTVNLPTVGKASAEVIRRALRGVGFTFFTLNLDHVVKLRASPTFHAIYRRATFVSADGWPIVWLARRRGANIERTCGADLVEPICAAAASQAIPTYFIGPGASAQAGAIGVLRARYPDLAIAGAEATEFSQSVGAVEGGALAARLNASGARLCFVCLGAPKQEILADALARQCPGVGFVCVGAALDFISGHARRAPVWMRRSGLEWFWRLISQPRRLAARYAECAYVFLLLALGASIAPE